MQYNARLLTNQNKNSTKHKNYHKNPRCRHQSTHTQTQREREGGDSMTVHHGQLAEVNSLQDKSYINMKEIVE